MQKDFSYGIILVDKGEENKFLILKHNGGHWGFPKGHKEGSESGEEAARRELKEEAGIGEYQSSELPSIKERYFFTDERGDIDKEIEYFLAYATSKEVKIQPEEIKEYKWATFEEAMDLFQFKEGKEVLATAAKMLK